MLSLLARGPSQAAPHARPRGMPALGGRPRATAARAPPPRARSRAGHVSAPQRRPQPKGSPGVAAAPPPLPPPPPPRGDGGDYSAPAELSLWDDDTGAHYSSARGLAGAYRPPAGLSASLPGLSAALCLVSAWALVFRHACFDYDLAGAPTGGGLLHALEGLATFASLEFLSTGLFITAHDAMHGAVAPSNRLVNDAVGALCLSLYAWFDYGQLWRKHWAHHNHTGQRGGDPDFHAGDPALLPWFGHFLSSYFSWAQLARLHLCVLLLAAAGARLPNLALFWAGAGLLSATRLFYYGTYRPHRPRRGGPAAAAEAMPWPKARSPSASRCPAWLSTLRCFNFGLHWEHHRWPDAPWWDLPRARRVRQAALGSLDE